MERPFPAEATGMGRSILFSALAHFLIIGTVLAAVGISRRRSYRETVQPLTLVESVPQPEAKGEDSGKSIKEEKKAEEPEKKKEEPKISPERKKVDPEKRKRLERLRQEREEARRKEAERRREEQRKLEALRKELSVLSGKEGKETQLQVGLKGFPAWYITKIHNVIFGNWELPVVAGKPACIVTFEILRSGEVENIAVEESSGNSFFDRSALEAVRSAKSFPPLPGTVEESFVRVHVNFSRHVPR